jgi:uncharacterized protein YecT (DUF1311 family)
MERCFKAPEVGEANRRTWRRKPYRAKGRRMELSSTRAGIALALAFVLAAGAGAAAESAKASFDCAKAKSGAEQMICADPGLAAADAAIAANYASALKRLDSPARKALAQDQQDFVSYRDRTLASTRAFRRRNKTFRSTSSCATAPPSSAASKDRMLASWGHGKMSGAS